MALLLLFAVLALMAVCRVGLSWLARWWEQGRRQACGGAVSPPLPATAGAVDGDSDEELLEGILIAERLTGVRSPDDYQRAMAAIAAQDAVSHPLAVPPKRL